jgi:hypothetical protein
MIKMMLAGAGIAALAATCTACQAKGNSSPPGPASTPISKPTPKPTPKSALTSISDYLRQPCAPEAKTLVVNDPVMGSYKLICHGGEWWDKSTVDPAPDSTAASDTGGDTGGDTSGDTGGDTSIGVHSHHHVLVCTGTRHFRVCV